MKIGLPVLGHQKGLLLFFRIFFFGKFKKIFFGKFKKDLLLRNHTVDEADTWHNVYKLKMVMEQCLFANIQ